MKGNRESDGLGAYKTPLGGGGGGGGGGPPVFRLGGGGGGGGGFTFIIVGWGDGFIYSFCS